MNIVVCVKQVPDTAVERTLRPSDGTLDRAAVDGLINELDEYAIEEGLQIAEAQRGAGSEAEVTIVSMGPEKATESIRKALSMGADKAVHLVDDGLAGSDALSTSYALAQVLRQTGFDLVICGSESTDARMGVMAAMLAERLDVPQASLAAKKKPVQTLSLADAGIDPALVGLGGSATGVVDHVQRPPRQAGTIVKDESDGGVKIAEFLATGKFI